MRLIDLLETAKETQDIIVRDDWALGIIYSKRLDCFCWCDISGEVVEDKSDIIGWRRVTLSSNILDKDDWYLIPNPDNKIEKIKDIRNKVKKISYIQKRVETIMEECSINKALDELYRLGFANACGYILYMIDAEWDKKDIKKFIMDGSKDDVQFRCDLFGVWGELYDKLEK